MTQKKRCDNTSVAVILERYSKILLIERKEYNPGFALPAGHCDGDSEKKAAKKELFEEVGFSADCLGSRLLMTLQNPCKRAGGTFHRWTVFIAEKWEGDIKTSEKEVRSFIWADKAKIAELARKTEILVKRNGLSFDDLPSIVRATNELSAWRENLGLEPPMYAIFKELKII